MVLDPAYSPVSRPDGNVISPYKSFPPFLYSVRVTYYSMCVCNLLGVTWHRFPSYTPLYHARMTRPQRVLARRRTSPVLRLSLHFIPP